MTALLLDRGADVNAICTERTQTTTFRHGITPLHFAARYNREPAVAALLLDGGADADAGESANGLTPLLYVTWFSPTTVFEMVALLVDNGADINARDNDSITPLYYAVISEEVAVVALLLDRGADGMSTGPENGCIRRHPTPRPPVPHLAPVAPTQAHRPAPRRRYPFEPRNHMSQERSAATVALRPSSR